jgi:hypothetical protein
MRAPVYDVIGGLLDFRAAIIQLIPSRCAFTNLAYLKARGLTAHLRPAFK